MYILKMSLKSQRKEGFATKTTTALNNLAHNDSKMCEHFQRTTAHPFLNLICHENVFTLGNSSQCICTPKSLFVFFFKLV